MKHEISIRNGGGWNNYPGLKSLTSLPAGTKRLMAANGISHIRIEPTDPERPYGFSAFYFDAAGDEVFRQGFDQNDSAHPIGDCVTKLLTEGIAHRIAARRKEIAREQFIAKIRAWRNWETPINHQHTMNLNGRVGELNQTMHPGKCTQAKFKRALRAAAATSPRGLTDRLAAQVAASLQ